MPKSAKGEYVDYKNALKKAFKIENSELKGKDISKVIKLLPKISEGENVAEKLKKPTYKTRIILKTKVTFHYQDQDIVESTFTLLHYAILRENNQAFDDLLQEAINQKLLRNALNEEMIIKYSDGQEETHTILTYAILYKNYIIIRKVLKVSKEHGILEDILNKTVTVKDGQEAITVFDYVNKDNEVAKIFEEFKDGLNIPATEHKAVDDNTEAIDTPDDTELYKYDNEKVLKDNATAIENKDTDSVIDKAVTDQLVCNLTTIENEDATHVLDEANDTPGPCKNGKKILKDSVTAENKNTTSIEDINRNSKDNPLANIFLAKTTVREPTLKPCFDSVDKSSSARGKQAILSGGAGIVLLIGSIAFYTLKMHTIGMVGGIVGLACVGFALYNILKPNTKLESLRSIEQPVYHCLPI